MNSFKIGMRLANTFCISGTKLKLTPNVGEKIETLSKLEARY